MQFYKRHTRETLFSTSYTMTVLERYPFAVSFSSFVWSICSLLKSLVNVLPVVILISFNLTFILFLYVCKMSVSCSDMLRFTNGKPDGRRLYSPFPFVLFPPLCKVRNGPLVSEHLFPLWCNKFVTSCSLCGWPPLRRLFLFVPPSRSVCSVVDWLPDFGDWFLCRRQRQKASQILAMQGIRLKHNEVQTKVIDWRIYYTSINL